MKILINYADEKYRKAQRLNSWTGKYIAKFDRIYSFGPDDIEPEYKKNHQDIFQYKRGNGLWLWKSYFIDRVMQECGDGDYVFYVDSGSFFLKNADVLIRSFRPGESIWVSDNPTLECCFTKPECFQLMECDTEEIRYSNQIQGGYLVFRCCDETKQFVKEWKKHCESIELMKPAGSLNLSVPVGKGFVAHREDQSILSLLCKKKGIRPHRDPSQRGAFPETFYSPYYAYAVSEHKDDRYGTFLFLHKQGSLSVPGCMKQCVKMLLAKIKVQRRMKHVRSKTV